MFLVKVVQRIRKCVGGQGARIRVEPDFLNRNDCFIQIAQATNPRAVIGRSKLGQISGLFQCLYIQCIRARQPPALRQLKAEHTVYAGLIRAVADVVARPLKTIQHPLFL